MTATTVTTTFTANTRIRDVLGIYFRFASPRLLAGLLAILVIARIIIGQWSWWDLIAFAVIVAAQPFVEWIIHAFILHFSPRSIGTLTIDLHLAKKHRQHHEDPKKIADVFIPIRALLVGLPILAAAVSLIFPLPVALTVLVTEVLIGNVYEWMHFYVHSGCKPRSRYVRYIERSHRLHHYRNENYWLGVTNHTADYIFGTFPRRDEVPVSPTAKTFDIN